MLADPVVWQDVGRPGYFGSKRDEKHRQYDERYGKGNWRIVWRWRIGEVIPRGEVVLIYEDAYYHFLRGNQEVLRRLLSEASDVYDDAPSNVRSGFDYAVQETGRTHMQDIAIRRAVFRLGRRFEGEKLIQIRDKEGEHALSMALSPGQVPFHIPTLIYQPERSGWWKPRSVESFYQSNKVLQVMAG